ncbi:MAG: efflux RND transporter permease subunit [Solirubrobacterales bacterium]
MRNLLARIAGWCVERPVPVVAAAVLVTVVAAVGALMLEADASERQLVDTGSTTFKANEDFKREFGDYAVAVLVRGDLQKLVLTSDLRTLLALEACLSGNAPGGQAQTSQPAPAPCQTLAETKPAKVVYGPATFLNQAAIQAGKLVKQQTRSAVKQAQIAAAKAAAQARRQGASEADQKAVAQASANEVINGFYQQMLQLAVRYGQNLGPPSINDPRFVSSVVFDSRAPGQPKPKFSYLFPSSDSALISVRLRPDLSESERRDAIGLIRAAVADPAFKIKDASYVVGGEPVVVADLTDDLSAKVFVLLAIAFAVMAIVLLALLRPPLRLLPLAIALASAAITFGGLAALGGSLTLGSLAVMPVLIGLAVDYAIQFQARFAEARESGSSPPAAAVSAAARGGTNIGIAVIATAAGFLVLLLWPIPVIRSFGLLLLAGIAIAFTLSLTAGLAALSVTPARAGTRGGRVRARTLALTAGLRAAFRRLGLRVRDLAKRGVAVSVAHSGRLLAIGAILAAAGWIAGSQTQITTDIRALLPSDLQALKDVDQLEEGTGVSGEVDVTVTAPDLTDPAVITWMRDYKTRVLADAGFSDQPTSCADQSATLCPSIALPDVFGSDSTPTRSQIQQVIDLLPPYFAQAIVDRDPATGDLGHTAVIAFGIKVMPFDQQKALVDRIRSAIDPPGTESDPPPGVSAHVVGLPVLIADASSGLDRDRYLFTLYGIVAVGVVLLLVYRSWRRALVPLIPIVLATGWSALAVWALGIDLNPMSATLGVLVIAIATEFSVLLCARYEEERRGRAALGDALRSAYSRTGTAVAASGITAIAGFAVLGVSDIPMVRDFGLVTVLDLAVALASVLIILPAALVWSESGFAPFATVAARLRARRGRPRTATP